MRGIMQKVRAVAVFVAGFGITLGFIYGVTVILAVAEAGVR